MSLYDNVTRIIFIPTFRCQNRCSYCDYRWETIEKDKSYKLSAFGNEWIIREELHWAYWLAALSKFKPYHLSFTGGEPTLWNGIVDFVEHLPRSCSWDITSNTMNEWAVDKMMPSNIRTWTASYHYQGTEKFLQNIKVLRQRGFPVTVTLVLTPDNLEKVKEAVVTFNKSFIRVNIHKLLKQGHSWKGHELVIAGLKKFIAEHNKEKLVKYIDLIRDEFQKDGAVKECSAGKNFMVAFPDGRVYRCYSHALSEGKEALGNITTFERHEKLQPCEGGCIFPCDLECQAGRHLDL